jgi:formylglycine-generating enzyme required for sulfatase activity
MRLDRAPHRQTATSLPKMFASLCLAAKLAPNPAHAAHPACDGCPKMVHVRGGSLWMGSRPTGDPRDPADVSKRKVVIRRFEISRTEVAHGQWRALMGSNPSHFQQCGDDCPVENVSWNDAQSFTNRLNALTDRRYRLPSEAEWDYAARAGSSTAYPWGDEASHDFANYGEDACCTGHANGRDRRVNTIAPVAQFPPHAFGSHDMMGNVWEWVQGSRRKGGKKIVRGGCWFSGAKDLRSSARCTAAAGVRTGDVGSRIARTL